MKVRKDLAGLAVVDLEGNLETSTFCARHAAKALELLISDASDICQRTIS